MRSVVVKGDANLLAVNIKGGVSLFGVAGSIAGVPATCSSDGQSGCVASASYPAANATGLASKVLSGQTVAGVAGNVVLPGAASVRSSVSYGVGGNGSSGGLANCSAEGGSDCVVDAGTSYRAADTTGLASKVLSTASVAGVSGNVTLPAAAAVRSSVAYGVGGNGTTGAIDDCSALGRTGCFNAIGWTAVETSQLVAGVIKSGTTLGGVSGDYPSATYPLMGNTATSDLTSLASSTAAGSYEFFDSAGTRYTGTITDAGAISIGTSAQTFSASLYRQFTVPGDADLVVGNIVDGVNILGVTGNVVLPAASDVRNTVAFGPASASTGNYSPDFPDAANVRSIDTVNGAAGTLADCSTDGATGCVVPSSGTIKAADTANFTGWDIRKKRNQTTGAVLTFAGIASQGKSHCRNRANRTIFDNGSAPATAATLDVFDTIDDYNNNLTGLPGEIPAWTIINSTNYGADYACGGIYATGDTATGNTGADASLAHDPNGNWQDLTPGILPGGSNSTNTANGCNASDKHCVFRELISGLMVTEVSATTYTWANAISYCHNLGEAGGAVTSHIPVIGGATYSDWRLPTQKELMQIYQGGVRGLNQTSNLTTFFGDVDTWFWSSSSVSNDTSFAWLVNLYHGSTYGYSKTNTSRVVCVR